MQIEQAGILAKDGFADTKLTLGTHLGTHIDAPAHMIEGGKTLDQYPVDRFIGTAIVLDIQMDIQLPDKIDAVFFYTGAADRYGDTSYWEDYPVISQMMFGQLVEHKIGLIGIDAGSVDIGDDFPIHRQLLSSDILIIENLTSLKDLIGKKVEFTALPLKVALDGAPCRVIVKV